MADLVIAKGMQFWGTHGYYPEENKFGAKFVIDVEAAADEDAMCQHDQLEGGVSYMTLYGCAKKVVTEEQHKLLQRVAQRISDEIFTQAPQVERVTVTVKKPFVAVGGVIEYTAVSITRTGKGAKSDGNAVPYTGINPLKKDETEYGQK
jgi:dihydroneopterin aldolase